MHTFKRQTRDERVSRLATAGLIARCQQKGPQPLAPVQGAMPHGRHQPFGPDDLRRQRFFGKAGRQRRLKA